MAGLNYGNTYHHKKQMPEGVVWGDKINKWLVRIKRERINVRGKRMVEIASIASYLKKEDAEEHFNNLINKFE